MSYDLLIVHGTIMPGDGPGFSGDVAVKGGRIAAIAPHISPNHARQVVDAGGHWVCPGFIDCHAHSALQSFQRPDLAPKVAQGFTTEVIHPDGLAPAPVRPEQRAERQRYLAGLEGLGPPVWTWTTQEEYLTALERTRPVTSLVPSVGHNAIREYVMGTTDRRPDSTDIRAMQREIAIGAELGARFFSLGLIYPPGVYADTDELIALAKTAAQHHLPLAPHIRDEGRGVLTAIQEMAAVCRASGASLHLSHLKVVGGTPSVEELLALIDALGEDVDLTFDQYPYRAGNTLLSTIVPPWALNGGSDALLARLQDGDARQLMARDIRRGADGWESIYTACGSDNIVLADVAGHPELGGLSLTDLGRQQGCDPLDSALDLLLESHLHVTMLDFYATEDVVRTIFQHPRALVGTDGIFSARPHPRLYGTAARVLGRYAIAERLVTAEEALFRLTAGAADRLNLPDRGRVKTGLRADLVILNPTQFRDTATFENPCQYPPGLAQVFIHGEAVWENGRPTGARPGGVCGR
jgi:N-acyl-D-amino-acid deacylase